MPTSSVAQAKRDGRLLQTAVMGKAPEGKRRNDRVGSAASFPGKPKEPEKAHTKGRPAKPADSIDISDTPAEDEESALEATSWGASDPAIRAQLERELGALREQLALRQQISGARALLHATPHSGTAQNEAVREGHIDPSIAFSDRELDNMSMKDIAELAQPPPPIDKEEARLMKRVAAFEARIVRSLIDRTPFGGPQGPRAFKVLLNGFVYYDSDKFGTCDQAGFTKVLHAKLNAVPALPPPPQEVEVIKALFDKHAKGAEEMDYASFCRSLLHQAGVLVPEEEVIEKSDREEYHYSKAVQQAQSRRNLGRSKSTVPDFSKPREAYSDASAAARASEEGLAYRVQPLKDASGAGLRGRLPGGEAGFMEYKRLEAERNAFLKNVRRNEARIGAAEVEAGRAGAALAAQEALAGWNKIKERNTQLGDLTPGQAVAAARRMR